MARSQAEFTELTFECVRSLFYYDPSTGELRWKINRGHGVRAGDVAGCIKGRGYRVVGVHPKQYKAHRLIWLWVYGEWPPNGIDHINGDFADNRLDNLRAADQLQNCANRKRHKNNISGFKGVFPHGRRWQAEITVNYKAYHLGSYSTPQEAHAAYVAAAREHFGDFARPE